MIYDFTTLFGRPAIATDRAFGYFTDFYIDPTYWEICYTVTKTDAWGDGRLVLIAVQYFHPSPFDLPRGPMVNLTREQIARFGTAKNSCPSGPQPSAYIAYSHFLPSNWQSSGMGRRSHGPSIFSACPFLYNALHSVKAMTGFRLEKSNGSLGKLEACKRLLKSLTSLASISTTAMTERAQRLELS